jgi:predicted XRE-type DNA-binding protein
LLLPTQGSSSWETPCSTLLSANMAKHDVQAGTRNVFADLGLADADERLAKAELAHEICRLIKAAGLTQVQAARRLHIDQPKVSALTRGRLKDFSTARLLRFINLLGRDVDIVIRPAQSRTGGAIRVCAEA